jgi:hypothetical protein
MNKAVTTREVPQRIIRELEDVIAALEDVERAQELILLNARTREDNKHRKSEALVGGEE